MNAEIISIGTELLLGHIINTNAPFISERLSEIGIDVFRQVTVGDNAQRLSDAIKDALSRSDIVITSGGLGPTVDDITVEAVSRVTGEHLTLDRSVIKDMEAIFGLRNMKIPEDSLRQAYVPEGSKVIRNPNGTAPGLILKTSNKLIVCLPGPPRECEPMIYSSIIPFLKKASGGYAIKTRIVRTTGLGESQVNRLIKEILSLKPPTTVGIYARLGEVYLKIMSKALSEDRALSEISRVEKRIRKRLKKRIFGYDDDTLESCVLGILSGKMLTIAIAESCTGGLLSSRLTDVSGSSKCLIAGTVTYANAAKSILLDVPESMIKSFGAVSKQVAGAMARNIRSRTGSDIGLGISGIAGPRGGTRTKPVGLVYISISMKRRAITREFRFRGSRKEIKFQATQAALDILRLTLDT